MTFIEENISNISVDMTDDWQYDDDGTCSVMINGLEGFACNFFQVDLDDQYPDGWVNTYVIIDPTEKKVIRVLFTLDLNSEDENDGRELLLAITNPAEMEALYRRLEESGGREFVSFINSVEIDAG